MVKLVRKKCLNHVSSDHLKMSFLVPRKWVSVQISSNRASSGSPTCVASQALMSCGQRLLDVAEECVHELLWHVEHLQRLSHYARRSSAIRNWLSGRPNHSSEQSHNTRFFISSRNLHQICYYLFMLVRDRSKHHRPRFRNSDAPRQRITCGDEWKIL